MKYSRQIALAIFLSLQLSIVFGASIPVSVNSSSYGSPLQFPSMSGGYFGAPPTGDYWYFTGSTTVWTQSNYVSNVTGTPVVTSTHFGPPGGYYNLSPVNTSLTPFVTISNAVTTNFMFTITVIPTWHAVQMDQDAAVGMASQDYDVTVVDSVSVGGVSGPSLTVTPQADALESISRKNTDTSLRKILGFSMVANTNSLVTSMAFALSNSSTNGNNFSSIVLLHDADGGGIFDGGDTTVATTTNANGYAIFTGLNQNVSTNAAIYFLAASFTPTNQTRNSFLTGSLNTQNISVRLFSTNVSFVATGGSMLGKQYGFFDTTQVEDDAAAAALAAQIASSTNGLLNASQVNSLISSATSGLGNTSSTSTAKTSSFSDSVLPAAAAGAAGVAAAFSSDSISKAPLSSEFTQPR